MKTAYRVISSVLATIVLCILLFAPIIKVSAESLASQFLVSLGANMNSAAADEIIEANGGNIPDHISLELSVADVVTDKMGIFDMLQNNSDEEMNAAVKTLLGPLSAFIVALAVLAICAIVTIIISIMVKDNRKVIFASMAGIGLTLVVKTSFEAVAGLFLKGEISVASLLGTDWASLLADIDAMKVTAAIDVIPFIFAGIIIWTLLYNVTLPDKEKLERKILIGEAVAVEDEKKTVKGKKGKKSASDKKIDAVEG